MWDPLRITAPKTSKQSVLCTVSKVSTADSRGLEGWSIDFVGLQRSVKALVEAFRMTEPKREQVVCMEGKACLRRILPKTLADLLTYLGCPRSKVTGFCESL
jgi:hypothetical protein